MKNSKKGGQDAAISSELTNTRPFHRRHANHLEAGLRKVACDNCQEENTFISAFKSYRCQACKEPLDWRLKVLCNNCGHTNRIFSDEKEVAKCKKCEHDIKWSIDPSTFQPNIIPLKTRVVLFALTGFLVIANIYGLLLGKYVVPIGCTRHGKCHVNFIFEGWDTLIPLLSSLLGIISFSLTIIDHYDRRQNEYLYKTIISATAWSALILYFITPFFGARL